MTKHFSTVPVAAALPSTGDSAAESFRPLVLVVDDEPLITVTLAAILNAKGCAVLTAQDPAEALEISALMPPELLITDVAMPGMNGFDLAIAVKKIAPDCEVIFFSGHLDIAEMTTKLGDNEDCIMLIKPVHPADLIERVHEVLKRRGRALRSPKASHTLSLYEFLSSVVTGSDVYPSEWNFTLRHRQRPAGHFA